MRTVNGSLKLSHFFIAFLILILVPIASSYMFSKAQAPCMVDEDCVDGEMCLNGICVSGTPSSSTTGGCVVDDDCEDDEICYQGNCVPSGTPGTSSSSSSSSSSTGGEGDVCTSDDDCLEGFVCSEQTEPETGNHICIPAPEEPCAVCLFGGTCFSSPSPSPSASPSPSPSPSSTSSSSSSSSGALKPPGYLARKNKANQSNYVNSDVPGLTEVINDDIKLILKGKKGKIVDRFEIKNGMANKIVFKKNRQKIIHELDVSTYAKDFILKFDVVAPMDCMEMCTMDDDCMDATCLKCNGMDDGGGCMGNVARFDPCVCIPKNTQTQNCSAEQIGGMDIIACAMGSTCRNCACVSDSACTATDNAGGSMECGGTLKCCNTMTTGYAMNGDGGVCLPCCDGNGTISMDCPIGAMFGYCCQMVAMNPAIYCTTVLRGAGSTCN